MFEVNFPFEDFVYLENGEKVQQAPFALADEACVFINGSECEKEKVEQKRTEICESRDVVLHFGDEYITIDNKEL